MCIYEVVSSSGIFDYMFLPAFKGICVIQYMHYLIKMI